MEIRSLGALDRNKFNGHFNAQRACTLVKYFHSSPVYSRIIKLIRAFLRLGRWVWVGRNDR